jgi:hypothetical protein
MNKATQVRLKTVVYDLWDKGYRATPIKTYLSRNKIQIDDLSAEELAEFVQEKTPEQWRDAVAEPPPRSQWNNTKTIVIRVPEIFADRLLQVAREWDANGEASP